MTNCQQTVLEIPGAGRDAGQGDSRLGSWCLQAKRAGHQIRWIP